MFDNELWMAEPFTKAQAWIDLIGNANHKPASIWIRGIEINVDRGQLAWSELTMAKRWKWSRGKIRRYIGMLEKREMIVQQTNMLTSIITICNYSLYQEISTADGTTSRTRDSTTNGQQTDNKRYTNKNDKKNKNEKKVNTDLVLSTAGAVSDVDQVFEYWKKRMGKSGRTVLSPKRRRAIANRLNQEGRTVEELKQAIDGCASSPFHMGQGDNSNGTVYDDIELICRSNEQVERFMQMWDMRDHLKTNKRATVDLGDTSW
jgi:hypothetical protein